jgi:hypothetical protein
MDGGGAGGSGELPDGGNGWFGGFWLPFGDPCCCAAGSSAWSSFSGRGLSLSFGSSEEGRDLPSSAGLPSGFGVGAVASLAGAGLSSGFGLAGGGWLSAGVGTGPGSRVIITGGFWASEEEPLLPPAALPGATRTGGLPLFIITGWPWLGFDAGLVTTG